MIHKLKPDSPITTLTSLGSRAMSHHCNVVHRNEKLIAARNKGHNRHSYVIDG